MLKNIDTVLDALGLGPQKRALQIQFTHPILHSQLAIQRIEGRHWINEGLQAELLCLSTHPSLPLKQFMGVQVAVDQVTDRGDRKSTRLNSSHVKISYAVFCLKKKKKDIIMIALDEESGV